MARRVYGVYLPQGRYTMRHGFCYGIQRMMGAPKGKPKSAEHRAKIAAALRGTTKDSPHRDAIAESVRAYWLSSEGQREKFLRREASRLARLKLEGNEDGV